jgi:hypothetical protein
MASTLMRRLAFFATNHIPMGVLPITIDAGTSKEVSTFKMSKGLMKTYCMSKLRNGCVKVFLSVDHLQHRFYGLGTAPYSQATEARCERCTPVPLQIRDCKVRLAIVFAIIASTVFSLLVKPTRIADFH